MNKKDQLVRDPAQAEYAERMAKEIKAKGKYIHPMGDKQPASTLKLMSMPVDQPFISFVNPIADHPDDVKRPIKYDDFMAYEKMRRNVKNDTGDALSGISQEAKQKAIDAYLKTKPESLSDFQKLMHTLIEPEWHLEPKIKKSLLKKIKEWVSSLGKADQPIEYYFKDKMTLEQWNKYVKTGMKDGK